MNALIQQRREGFARTPEILRRAKADFEAVPIKQEQERQVLLREAEKMQMAAFLQRHLIEDAVITDIGPVRKATLTSHGYETAHDISYDIKNISYRHIRLYRARQTWLKGDFMIAELAKE